MVSTTQRENHTRLRMTMHCTTTHSSFKHFPFLFFFFFHSLSSFIQVLLWSVHTNTHEQIGEQSLASSQTQHALIIVLCSLFFFFFLFFSLQWIPFPRLSLRSLWVNSTATLPRFLTLVLCSSPVRTWLPNTRMITWAACWRAMWTTMEPWSAGSA